MFFGMPEICFAQNLITPFLNFARMSESTLFRIFHACPLAPLAASALSPVTALPPQ
jgi:hypothetical protein